MSGDDWDSVLDFEGAAFDEGIRDGSMDAIQTGEMFGNGTRSGFLKGFAYGLELGFMEFATSSRSGHTSLNEIPFIDELADGHSLHEVFFDAADAASSNHTEEEKSRDVITVSNKRISRRCLEISQRAKLVPDVNDNNFDFDKEIRELRSLYKLCGLSVGLFRVQQIVFSNTTTVANSNISNEW